MKVNSTRAHKKDTPFKSRHSTGVTAFSIDILTISSLAFRINLFFFLFQQYVWSRDAHYIRWLGRKRMREKFADRLIDINWVRVKSDGLMFWRILVVWMELFYRLWLLFWPLDTSNCSRTHITLPLASSKVYNIWAIRRVYNVYNCFRWNEWGFRWRCG